MIHWNLGSLGGLVLACLLTPGVSNANAPEPRTRIFLIPGAGSSADRIHVDGLDTGPWKAFKTRRYFGALEDNLKKEGMPTQVCPRQADDDTRSLSERADDCAQEILKQAGSCRKGKLRAFHLVGHSMGGLIARLLAQDARVKNCIASVTSISTPHQGTPFADFFMDHLKLDQTSIDLYGRLAKATRFIPERKRYIPELRVDRRGFANELFRAQDTKNNPAVKYFSITAALEGPTIHPLQLSKMILARELRKRGLNRSPYGEQNDGIVPEYSMKHGTLLGRIISDHWSTACLDPLSRSEPCSRTIALLLPHLKALCGLK
ncbi:MAG: hypothetical protein A2Z97_14360 [Bdellovibrionales bacterium GWB1_52_6]|nr:MAG: hypothetical protein A2Z97_14360 [Bdellovibrionales bacterium GWB1_52_6]OFZ06203.1 MAG: hypothetical protein A2X97_09120 [Bdellovibrionales bacterium GWA1_52_35]